MVSRKVMACVVVFLLLAMMSITSPKADQPNDGVSEDSWGRFATWPDIRDSLAEKYEGDLVKLVYADRIQRSHKGLGKHWLLYFGATSYYNSIANIPHFEDISLDDSNIWAEDQNWVYKKFAVLRENAWYGTPPYEQYGGSSSAPNYPDRDYTYTVSVNSMAPGTRVITEHNMFYLENDNVDGTNYHLGYAACRYVYPGYDGFRIKGDFSQLDDPGQNVYFTGDYIGENWMLFFDTGNSGKYEVHIPVMVSFSQRPGVVKCYRDSVEFHYWGSAGYEEKTFFISLPFGADAFDPDTTASWVVNGLPQYVIDQCREVNRIVNNWPVSVDEDFGFTASTGASPDNVVIENSFTYSYIGTEWESTGYVSDDPYGLVPPLVALAADEGVIPSDGLPSGSADIGTGFPTKYGPLKIVEGSSSIEYTIPGAPEHDIHLVGTPNDFETIWKQRINRMINREATSPGKYRASVGVLGAAGNRGEFASLAMTRDWTREHYIDFLKRSVHQRAFSRAGSADYGGNEGWVKWDWSGVSPPPSGSWPDFWAIIWAGTSANIPQPWDFNAVSGNMLEFLYEYGLWSGDWQVIQSNWTHEGSTESIGVKEMFAPLPMFHDWGYMSSSYCLFGWSGGIIDMFPSEVSGYISYAKMAQILGYSAEAGLGRYLAAKSQIPLVTRWAAKDYLREYYAVTDDMGGDAGKFNQVIAGFGEFEPTGPLSRGSETGVSIIHTVNYWADWTISGERIHPLTFDILDTFVDTDNSFENYLDDFKSEAASRLSQKQGSFMEDKLYCFYKWKKYTGLNQLIGDVRSLYSSQMGDMNGAAVSYPTHILNWYSNSVTSNNLYTPDIKLAGNRFTLMPAIVEAYGVPMILGSWAPAKLDSAFYDPVFGRLTAYFSNGDGTSGQAPIVRIHADERPSVGGDYTTKEWDSQWNVEEITLSGSGPWMIIAERPAYPGVEWTEVDPDHNLLSGAGFEDCGNSANIEMGWVPYTGNPETNFAEIYSSIENPHSGLRNARLELIDDEDFAYLWQKVWVKPVEAETPGYIPINIDFWYNIFSEDLRFWVTVQTFTNEINQGQSANYAIYTHSFTTEDPAAGWQHFEIPGSSLSVPSDSAVVQVFFGVVKHPDSTWIGNGDHWVDVDDVTLTCELLDTGVENEPPDPPDPPDPPGGGGKDDPMFGEALPLLSKFKIHPNPFNPATVVSFMLGKEVPVALKVYDPRGRLVRTLVDGVLPVGTHDILWDGKNSRGASVASGVYFYRFEVEDINKTGKLMLLR